MNRLESAKARLSVALDRLEASVEARSASAGQAASSAELALLKAERERLLARICALEEESRTMRGLTDEVEDRLDGAIAEVREALGRF